MNHYTNIIIYHLISKCGRTLSSSMTPLCLDLSFRRHDRVTDLSSPRCSPGEPGWDPADFTMILRKKTREWTMKNGEFMAD